MKFNKLYTIITIKVTEYKRSIQSDRTTYTNKFTVLQHYLTWWSKKCIYDEIGNKLDMWERKKLKRSDGGELGTETTKKIEEAYTKSKAINH